MSRRAWDELFVDKRVALLTNQTDYAHQWLINARLCETMISQQNWLVANGFAWLINGWRNGLISGSSLWLVNVAVQNAPVNGWSMINGNDYWWQQLIFILARLLLSDDCSNTVSWWITLFILARLKLVDHCWNGASFVLKPPVDGLAVSWYEPTAYLQCDTWSPKALEMSRKTDLCHQKANVVDQRTYGYQLEHGLLLATN